MRQKEYQREEIGRRHATQRSREMGKVEGKEHRIFQGMTCKGEQGLERQAKKTVFICREWEPRKSIELGSDTVSSVWDRSVSGVA